MRANGAGDDEGHAELLRAMVEELLRGADEPVKKVEGLGDDFLNGE
jgi:hypothetical protein